jgi:hypothetical protein
VLSIESLWRFLMTSGSGRDCSPSCCRSLSRFSELSFQSGLRRKFPFSTCMSRRNRSVRGARSASPSDRVTVPPFPISRLASEGIGDRAPETCAGMPRRQSHLMPRAANPCRAAERELIPNRYLHRFLRLQRLGVIGVLVLMAESGLIYEMVRPSTAPRFDTDIEREYRYKGLPRCRWRARQRKKATLGCLGQRPRPRNAS